MKTILYSVSTGYFARNLLRTGVLERLLEDKDIRIVIVSPGYEEKSFREEFSFSDRIFIENMLDVDRSYDLMDKLIWQCWSLGQRHGRFIKLYKFFLKAQLKKRYYNKFHWFYDGIFNKYNPDLVVGGTPGMNSRMDIPVFAEAQARNIKTLALIHSWDNISKRKGPLWVRPDILGVWNEFQKKESTLVHFYKDKDIKFAGASHFDIYWNDDTFIGRENFFKKMGLDQQKKLITVIVTVQNLVKSSFIVDILLDALKGKKFAVPVQLLCRLLPRFDPKKNDEEYGRYYANPDIVIDHQIQYSPKLGWNPNRQQLNHFANLVRYSDVQISIASTSTIEAAILDMPVVNVAFSTIEPELFKKRILEGVFKHHFKPILDYGATHVARDPDELIMATNRYLLDPGIHREEREKLKNAIFYNPDGKATQRVNELIKELV